jgi:hypothetical protein
MDETGDVSTAEVAGPNLRRPTAWVWAAWLQAAATEPVFIYGCCAPSQRAVKSYPEEAVAIGSATGAAHSVLTIRHAVIDAREADNMLLNMARGATDLSSIFGPSAPLITPKLVRRTLEDVLGHHGAAVDAYMTLPNLGELCRTPDALKAILSTLKARLGLPFTNAYASHLGNFEQFHLADWLEQQKPFTVEAPNPKKAGEPEPIHALAVTRTKAFARASHILHVECFSGCDTILDRIIVLPEKEELSPLIVAPGDIDGFAVRLFTADGKTLLHKETMHFFREINLVTSMAGRTITLDDKLTVQAHGANEKLGKKAATVQAQSSSRSIINMNGDDSRWRAHADRLQQFIAEHFAPQSADRWFVRSVASQLDVIEYINTLLHGGKTKAAILVDPFFGADALLRLAMRLSSTDIELTIITSLQDRAPDSGDFIPKGGTPQAVLESFLRQFHALINPKIKVMNLARPNGDQVFHDRYLLLYGHDQTARIYMLSNSINKMAGNYPFCMTVLAEDITRGVQDYIEALSQGQDISFSTQPIVTFAWPEPP